MAKKQLTGVELANDIMLKDLAAFMVSKKFYGKSMPNVLQEAAAKKDILMKSGKLRKMLDQAEIKTRYDIALGRTDAQMELFGVYGKIMKQFRNQIIKKSFQHRKNECL